MNEGKTTITLPKGAYGVQVTYEGDGADRVWSISYLMETQPVDNGPDECDCEHRGTMFQPYCGCGFCEAAEKNETYTQEYNRDNRN